MINPVKRALKEGKVTLGGWITIGHSVIAEIMGQAGFEWLTIDMEHSVITIEKAQELIQTIELSGVVPIVRVSENAPTIIKRVMDAGAYGVIVPMVNNVEDAQRAVRAVKYPPVGSRGVGLARAQGYGFEFDRYVQTVNEESLVIVQIEHIQAVNNIEEILSVNGIDGFVIGPYDLSGSMGIPGKFNHPDMIKALKRVMEASRSFKLPSGIHVVNPSVKEVIQRIREGYTFIAFGLDTLFLGQACRSGIGEIKKYQEEKGKAL